VAYGLVAALLEDYVSDASTTETAELQDIVTELAPHLWQLLFPDGEAPAEPGQGSAEVQQGLFQARVISLLLKRAQTRPLVLCLEDLHWADPASRQLLGQLAGRIAQSRLLIVRTLRSEEENNDLRRAQLELARLDHVHFIDLEPLSADESRALSSSCFDREGFTTELFDALHQRSRGVPFFLVQCLESLRQEGVIYVDRGLWMNRGLRETDMPESVRDAILRRINGLSPDDRDLLSFASVQGTVFEGLLLSRLISEPPRQVLRRLSDLMRRTRLIRAEGRKFCFGPRF
jgi:predicted ATPase